MPKIFIPLLLSIVFLFSCKKEDSSLTIVNELDNIILQNVEWDNRFVAIELLPKQSAELKISPRVTDLPKADFIRFEMKSANRRIGLRTAVRFEVKEEQDVRVVIDSALQVTVQ
ncbi:MAG: hypothetical protein AAGG68_03475 [Bacteroidota bacterium]